MIIWTRWGIFAFLFFGLGVGLGFLLKSLLGFGAATGHVTGVFVGIGLMLSSGALYAFDRFVVRRHLDKPRPMYVTERLAEPVPGADGTPQHVRTVPAVHPETGQPILVTPRSTLFFIPLRVWPFLIGAFGAIWLVVDLVRMATA